MSAYGWQREPIADVLWTASGVFCTGRFRLRWSGATRRCGFSRHFGKHFVRNALAAFAEGGAALTVLLRGIHGHFPGLHCITSWDDEKVLAAVARTWGHEPAHWICRQHQREIPSRSAAQPGQWGRAHRHPTAPSKDEQCDVAETAAIYWPFITSKDLALMGIKAQDFNDIHPFGAICCEEAMNEKAPDTREVFLWRGRDDDLTRLTEVVAAKTKTELFNEDGQLVRLHGGRLVPVNKEGMREIVTRHVKTLRPVNRGTDSEPHWEVDFYSFGFPPVGTKNDVNRGLNEKALIDLIDALVPHVAKTPRRPVEFKPQQLQEIRTRLRSGEPAYIVARSYGVELDVIQEMERARRS
jgi:hypothetical protein